MARHTLANELDCRQTIARAEKISPDCVRQWGKMSPHEMVCHLSDSFLLVMGEKTASMAPRSELPAPLPRSVIRWFALDVPLRWPQGIPTRPEMDPQRLGTRPAAFDADHRKLLQLTERFTRRPADFTFAIHPIFGAMTERDWMRWGYLHMDHHLRQFGL